MIVLDANILIRAVLGRRVLQILGTYNPLGFRFLAPEIVFEDAEKYSAVELSKRGRPADLAAHSIQYLRSLIDAIAPEVYAPEEEEARRRLKGRDEEDWPILASALALDCPIWTEDRDFFGAGIATWTTDRVEIFLKKQAQMIDAHRQE